MPERDPSTELHPNRHVEGTEDIEGTEDNRPNHSCQGKSHNGQEGISSSGNETLNLRIH
jgi:hypothetical protein